VKAFSNRAKVRSNHFRFTGLASTREKNIPVCVSDYAFSSPPSFET
jgi:hypothetical protein